MGKRYIADSFTTTDGRDLDLTKLNKNTLITAATNTKVTYDANGLVTAGTFIVPADVIGLIVNGEIKQELLPKISITDTFVVATEASMLAVVAEKGDVAVRTDLNKTYILKGDTPGVFTNWQELLTPTSAVTTADQITETTTRVFVSPTQKFYLDATSSIQTQLNSKAPSTGSGSYVQNQNAAAQSANMWISGTGTFGTGLNSGGLISSNSGYNGVLDLNYNTGITGGLVYWAGGTASKFSVNNTGAGTFASTVTAPTFIGALDGNAATATNSTKWNGYNIAAVLYASGSFQLPVWNSTNQRFEFSEAPNIKSWLGAPDGATLTGNVLSLNNIKLIDLSNNNPSAGPLNTNWAAIRGSGRSLYRDEEFVRGSNDVTLYNNSAGTGVTHTREASTTSPNVSGFVIKINVDGVGATSPGLGGFIQNINSRANGKFVQIFRAKIPVGYTLIINENSQGVGSTSYWATNNVGTGKWEEYTRVSLSGDTGPFGSGGHVSLNGPAGAVVWYLASCNVYDITATDYAREVGNIANTVVLRDGSGGFSAGAATFSSNVTAVGVSSSADIKLTGGGRGVSFNGLATQIYETAGSLRLYTSSTDRLTIASTGEASFSSSVTASSFITKANGNGMTLAIGGAFNSGATQSSMHVSDGNIHIDPKSGNSTYLGYYTGGGTNFGGGANNIVASVNSSGVFTGANFSGPGTGLTGHASGLSTKDRWYDGWITSPGYDANTIGANKNGFTYSNNAPLSGQLINFSSGGYNLQLNSNYTTGVADVRFRTHQSDTNAWGTWGQFITSGNIGSQSVSYANSAGNATTVGGFTPSQSIGAANRVVVADANGYIQNNWFNSNRADESTAAASYIYDTGDGYMRKKSLANARAEIVSSTAVTNAIGTPWTSYLPLAGGTLSGNLLFSNSGLTKRGIQGTNGDNDYWFIGGGATATNAGFLEIATGDDGQGTAAEPIYVSQYGPGDPLTGTLIRRAVLLDEKGSTSFPGDLSIGTATSSSSLIMGDSNEGSRYLHCNSNRIGFLTQATGWGAWCEDNGNWVCETDMRAANFYGNFRGNLVGTNAIYSTTVGTAYNEAVQMREVNGAGAQGSNMIYAPRLAFHWSGVVASSIVMEASGRIAIVNNPGTAYEDFIAKSVFAAGFFASSDIRLKNVIKKDYNATEVKSISYTWKDKSKGEKIQVGYSAQEVQKYMPDAVNEDDKGMLSVNYIQVLVAKVATLEKQLKQLQDVV